MKEITPTLFEQNCYLRCIDLRNNRIAKLPENICDLPQLWKLRLDYNYLIELPSNIGKLQRLEMLTVSQNKLHTLPIGIFTLQEKLQVLQLNVNEFEKINKSIC